MTALVALLGGVRATVFAALLLAALGWGCWQSHAAASARGAVIDARGDLRAANARIDGFRALLGQVNAVADEQLAAARAKAAEGAAAAERAEVAARAAKARAEDAQRRLQAAKAEPTCADQLRIELCPSIPLL